MPCVNLWECMTNLQNTDRPIADQVKELIHACGKHHGFGNELSLDVNEYGTWVIKVFNCFNRETDSFVELRVSRSGDVSVTRRIETGNLTDERTLRF